MMVKIYVPKSISDYFFYLLGYYDLFDFRVISNNSNDTIQVFMNIKETKNKQLLNEIFGTIELTEYKFDEKSSTKIISKMRDILKDIKTKKPL